MELAVYPQLHSTHNEQYWDEQGNPKWRESQVNCGAAGGAGLANWGHAQPELVTHHDFRLKAGNPGFTNDNGVWIPTGLSTSGIQDALTKLGCTSQRYAGASIWIAAQALQAGKAVGFAVNYGTINAFQGAAYSGDRNFTEGHFLVCKGWKRQAGVNLTGDWDSLLDGRPKRRPILTAPTWAPFRMIRAAAGDFRVGNVPVGAGKGIFIIVEPAE